MNFVTLPKLQRVLKRRKENHPCVVDLALTDTRSAYCAIQTSGFANSIISWRYWLPGTKLRHRCRADFTAGRRDDIRGCWDSTKIVPLQAQLPEVWFVPAGLLVSSTLKLVAGLFVTVSIMGLLLDATLTPAEPVSVEFDAGSLAGGLAGPD